jgi:hypothetical protein
VNVRPGRHKQRVTTGKPEWGERAATNRQCYALLGNHVLSCCPSAFIFLTPLISCFCITVIYSINFDFPPQKPSPGQAKPPALAGFGPRLGPTISKAEAGLGQAKAMAFRPSRAGTSLIHTLQAWSFTHMCPLHMFLFVIIHRIMRRLNTTLHTSTYRHRSFCGK